MTRLHPLVLALLMLALMATSVTMAVARGQVPSGETMVICSGYGTTTISVDAAGNPTGPVHPCPECLMGLVAVLAPALPDLARPDLPSRKLVAVEIPPLASRSAPPARARDPPLSI
ncbi:MAG: hypothetical protein Q8P60_12970 [Pseudorhodobacter sp.]|nr:hypothetical protein [Pseudorhodobacter sp.]